MSETMPAVSVLVPVHNAGDLLRSTIRSVLAQSVTDFEIIIVDDGSTDGQVDEIATLGEPRIRILRQDCRGTAVALNAAMALARGRFLALLDHDDLWLPHKLDCHLRDFEERSKTDLNFSWCRFVDEHGDDLGLPVRQWYGTISRDELLIDFVIRSASTIMVRREAAEEVGGFDPTLPRLCDLDFVLRVALLRPGNCNAVPEVLTLYRRHESQMSRQWCDLRKEWQQLLTRSATCADGPSAVVRSIADSNMHRYFAWLASEQKDCRSAVALLAAGIRRSPRAAVSDPRNWLLAAEIAARRMLPAKVYEAARGRADRAIRRLTK